MPAQPSTAKNRSSLLLVGILFVILGSSSYGMLSTLVKFAYGEGFTTAEVTTAQFLIGSLILTIMSVFIPKESRKAPRKDLIRLMVSGAPIAFTSIFYYLTVRYIDASVAVVLLMQSVWMGVAFEAFQKRAFPEWDKVFAVVLIFFGTLLATKVLGSTNVALDPRGIILGLLTAMSFTWVLYSTSSVASYLPSIVRSQYMLYGGLILVLLFAFMTQIGPHAFGLKLVSEDFLFDRAFDLRIFVSYGFVVAIFGTVIPPIMLNRGFPIVGVGLGSILSSVELPVAMFIAFAFLGEEVVYTQWVGVLIILSAIVLLNGKLFFAKLLRRPTLQNS